MKKLLSLSLLLGVSLVLTGCTRGFQSAINNWTYTSPVKVGGTWTVIQGDTTITGCRCLYWSTEDDDACFEKDGKKIFVNGSSIIIEEGRK